MTDFRHNTFRVADAIEYVDAYRDSVKLNETSIRQRLAELNCRMAAIQSEIPSYLLAAYRGYEDALAFVTAKIVPTIVKLDDRDASVCA